MRVDAVQIRNGLAVLTPDTAELLGGTVSRLEKARLRHRMERAREASNSFVQDDDISGFIYAPSESAVEQRLSTEQCLEWTERGSASWNAPRQPPSRAPHVPPSVAKVLPGKGKRLADT